MDKLKRISELTQELAELIADMDTQKDETKKTYRYIVKRLPKTELVEEECKDKGCYFQGISCLYSNYESKNLLLEEKRNLILAFCFMTNDEAKVSLGFYTDPEIFHGTWHDTLIFIFKKIEDSSIFEVLIESKKDILRKTMKDFGQK